MHHIKGRNNYSLIEGPLSDWSPTSCHVKFGIARSSAIAGRPRDDPSAVMNILQSYAMLC